VQIHEMSTANAAAWTWSTDGIVTPDGLVLTSARGIYFRSVPLPLPSHATEWIQTSEEREWAGRAAASQRIHGFLKSVHLALAERDVKVINPLWGHAFHRSKPGTDLRLAAAGIPVPRGVATSDPDLVRDFMEEVGQVVYKPVAGGGRCRKLQAGRVDDHATALAAAPCYFQELIQGDNLRIYTLGDRVVTAFLIESDQVDYREREQAISVFTPPGDVCKTAVRAASELGLIFAGSDIKLLPDGSHVVLDVNPSPMFAALDERVAGKIADSLAIRLLSGLQ